ncbi:unnamed protein product [Hapterophycus canaliculatus]
MSTRRLWLTLLVSWIRVPTGVLALASCCVNSTSGVNFDDCVCLVDNTQLSSQFLAAGETRLYHWVLSMNNSELVSGSVRGNLTFEMTPCNGSASIDIKSGSPSSWQYLPHFNSSDDFNPTSVMIPAKFTEQACLVTAGDVDTTFDVGVHTTLYDRSTPGNGGSLSAEMITSGTARIIFDTTATETAGEVMYNLYWSNLPEISEGACSAASENASLRENPNCLFWSACGIENSADGQTGWVTLASNTSHTFEVSVDDDSSYLFNVVMTDARNVSSIYSGTNVSFTSTNYQDCVADPDCTSQLNDDSTIIAIATVALGALGLLITGMKLLHKSIAKVMRETVSSRRGQSYISGTRALLDTKSISGKNQWEDEATPMASPANRFDGGGSSTYKSAAQNMREDDEGLADSELLSGSSEKPPNRGTPKRASVGSPSSKSPRRSASKLGKDDGSDGDRDTTMDENSGRDGGFRLAAASPRKRNKRRGGGGARPKEEKDEADSDLDGRRAAPRSDLDNSSSGGGGGMNGDEKPWQTSSSARSSPTGGTRTHKSTMESMISRREPGRSRGPSPKAIRSDNDDGDNAVDEDGRGPVPRERRAGRNGGWEKEVARSNTVQSMPRRRKPRRDEDRDRGGKGEGGNEQDD